MGLIQKNRFFVFWSVLGAIATLVIWYLPWRFQVNDDEVMMWLVSGAYTGTPETYAVFIHPVLSWIFAKLYTIAPDVKWYPLTWFIILYINFLVFVNLSHKRSELGESKNIWILFAFAFLIHFLFFLQFSIVAAFSIGIGLAARISKEKFRMFSIFPEDLLILIGFLVRPEVLFLFLGGTLVVLGGFFRDKAVVKMIFIPAMLWFFGIGISWVYLEVNGLQKFQEINSLRSQVFDHPVLYLHKEEFKEIAPELYYFSNGLIDFQTHPELVSKLPQWKELLDSKRSELLSLDSVFMAISTFVLHEHFLLGLMGLFLVFALRWNCKKAGLISLFLIGVLILSTPFYLIKIQIYGIIFLFFFMNIFLTVTNVEIEKYFNRTFILVLLVGIGFHFYSFLQIPKNITSGEKLSFEIKNLRDFGQIFLIDKGEKYRNLLFENPLPFKIFGWPTLLENQMGVEKLQNNIYFVDSATYLYNIKYFENLEIQKSNTDLILLIQK